MRYKIDTIRLARHASDHNRHMIRMKKDVLADIHKKRLLPLLRFCRREYVVDAIEKTVG